jgi:hypothetical protein
MVLGTEKCIRIRTRSTLTRVPAGYVRTHVQPYLRANGANRGRSEHIGLVLKPDLSSKLLQPLPIF